MDKALVQELYIEIMLIPCTKIMKNESEKLCDMIGISVDEFRESVNHINKLVELREFISNIVIDKLAG